MEMPDDPGLLSGAPRLFVTPRDRIVYLRSLADFEGVPIESVATLAQQMDEQRVRAGTTLIAAGESIERTYFLVEGRVGLYLDGERVGEIVPPSAVAAIGVLAKINGPPGDIIVEEDSLLLWLDSNAMRRTMETDFALLANALRGISRLILQQRGGLPFDPQNPPPSDPGVPPPRKMDFVEKLEWFSRALPFADTNLDAVGEFARLQEEVRFEAGSRIWDVGDQSPYSLGIYSGVVECENGWGRGDVGAGYTIGHFDSLAAVPRGYRVTAKTDVVALRADVAGVLDVLEDQFALAVNMLSNHAAMAVQQTWRAQFLIQPD